MKKITIKYKRYYVKGEIESDNLNQAMLTAYFESENNTSYVYEIIDGEKIYNRDDIIKYWDKNDFYSKY